MKDRLLAIIAVLIAASALGYTFWMQSHLDEVMDRALQRREAALVSAWKPKFAQIYSDMLGAEKVWDKEPTTLLELTQPMLDIMKKMQGEPGVDTSAGSKGSEVRDPKSAPPATVPKVNTFSIVACDPASGEIGVAVQSKYFGVGSVVPWAEAGVGAVATQSYAKMSYGPDGLRLMRGGKSPADALAELTKADAMSALRQVGMVDAQGRTAVHTGAECMAWAGHREGRGFTVEGNLLAGESVVIDMAAAFEKARTSGQGELADWMLAALQAGQAAGGDKRGQQSSALLVARAGGGPGGDNDRYIDLRVDDHDKPIEELGRLLELHKRFYAPAHLSKHPAADPKR